MGGVMTSRLRVHHVSRYSYDQPVSVSFNEARLTPLATPWQTPLESVLHIDEATWQHHYVDYWGTYVRAFEARRPHSELVVDATSVVEIDATLLPEPRLATPWDELRDGDVTDRFAEFLVQSRSTEPDGELAALAQESAAARTPHETALELCTRVHDAMTYLPGSTGVHTAASEAWAARSGVCQDYVHLVVGALRQVGVPARYVSGYLHPKNSEATVGEPAVGESHAWVEWWLGEWVAHDPTNDVPVGERHVIVGRGRDYSDVPPIKGIVGGSASATLDVSVEVTRLA
jgi:transglutaminase-like putative cysteine protease